MTATQPSANERYEWKRLSPVSIIYFIVKFTISFLRHGVLNILPGIAVFTVFVDNKLFWFSIMIPSLVLLIVIFSFLYYWFFKFQTKEGEIHIHRGVISKERLNLQYSRVQNVNIGTPFYFVPFNLVNCIIESAGSKSTEVNLPGVSKAFALDMRSDVFAAEHGDEDKVEETSERDKEADPSRPFLKLSNWESAKYGFTSYLAFILLAAFGPVLEKSSGSIGDRIFPTLMSIVGNTVLSAILIVVLSVLLVFLVITSASVVGAFIRFYHFELYNSEDKLVRVAGLLERKSTTLTKQKVQSVLIKQNLIARLLKRVSLQYRQVGAIQTKADDSSIQIPMLIPTEAKKFTSVVFEHCPDPDFSPIHPIYIRRVFLRFCLLPFAFIVSIPTLLISKLFLLALIALVPIFVLLKLRYRRYGFWYNDEFAAIKEGMLGQNIVIFPLYKVQLSKISQSRGQKRHQVGNLEIQLGSGTISIPYLPIQQLNDFVNLALYKTESSPKEWM